MHSSTDFLNDYKYSINEYENKSDSEIGVWFMEYCLCNTILNENDTIEFANFYIQNDKEFANYVNNNFDAVIMPQDPISISYIEHNINTLINFLNNLTIHVIAPSISFLFENNAQFTNSLKERTKKYINAILKRCTIIGIADPLSAIIINDLGYKKDIDYCINGYAGMHLNAQILKSLNKFPSLNAKTKMCIFRNSDDDSVMMQNFYKRIYKKYKKSYTINSKVSEFFNQYFNEYDDTQSKFFNNSKYISYFNIEGRLEELSYHHLCISENIFDCINALSFGIPTILISCNKHSESVANYYKIPYVLKSDINENTRLTDIISHTKYTFKDLNETYKQTLCNYYSFFIINDIPISTKMNEITSFKKLLCEKYKKSLNIDLDIPANYFIDEYRLGYYISNIKKQVWAIELDILDKIQKVCEKHDIKYYADAGTLLGTIRHEGFIPWDNDIDLVMFAKDYDKFIKVAKAELDTLELQDYHASPIIYNMKIRNKNSTFFNEASRVFGKYNYNQGLFVDVCRLDNVTDDEYDYIKFNRHLKLIKEECNAKWKLFWEYEKDNHKLEKESFIVREKFENLCRKYNNEKTEAIAVLANPSGNPFNGQELRKYKNEYNDVSMMDFEMLKMPVPNGYDTILKRLYGEYMVPSTSGGVHGKMYTDPIRSYEDYLPKQDKLNNKTKNKFTLFFKGA